MFNEKYEIEFNFNEIFDRVLKHNKKHLKYDKDIAEELGITTTHISNIRTQKKTMSFFLFLKICYVFDLEPNFLISGNIKGNNLNYELIKKIQSCNENQVKFIDKLIDSNLMDLIWH